eukprot:scaffold2353_cov167-Amphora_coffeaeformis.AAC.64
MPDTIQSADGAGAAGVDAWAVPVGQLGAPGGRRGTSSGRRSRKGGRSQRCTDNPGIYPPPRRPPGRGAWPPPPGRRPSGHSRRRPVPFLEKAQRQ